jgi:predicted transcriptional regulator
MKKTAVIAIVENLADDENVDLDALIDALMFRRKVERGLAAADAGDVISLEELEHEMEQWPG